MTEHGTITRRTALAGGGAVAAGALLSGLAASPASAATTSFASPAFPGMGLDQLVGQLVVYSYPGLTPPSELLALLRSGQVGGIIFFGENITSTAQIAGVVAQLRQAHAASGSRSPLLLMTDQEGGIVRRLKDQQPTMTARQIGDTGDVRVASAAGAGAAAGLTAAGMNLNLAPVVDVYRVEGNFDDQFGRSFSKDPRIAGQFGAAFASAQQSAGIAATAKHFPGLGAAPAGANTDLQAVTLTQSLAELRGVDEAAFVPSIRAGIDLVMASWAIYPALDGSRPAGLSRRVIQDELRGRLGFRGVTITDALEAGSLKPYGTDAQRAVLAAQAGMDVLLCSARSIDQGASVAAALKQALLDRQLDPFAFLGSLLRVRRLRSRLS